jgi:hypothetical protein
VTVGHHEAFKAARPPPPQVQLSMAAEEPSEYM